MADAKRLYLMNVYFDAETGRVEFADRTPVEGYVEGDPVPENYWLSLDHLVMFDFMLP